LEETRDNDEDVVSAYRETGEGWQTRINADLRRARKLNVATGTAPRNAKRAPVAHRNQGQPSEKIGPAEWYSWVGTTVAALSP
jgi:hypothetical protein